MASLSERLKTLHDSIAAYSTARLLIVPAHAQQIADEIAVLAADAETLEATLERRLKPAKIPAPVEMGCATLPVLIDLASRRPTNKKG